MPDTPPVQLTTSKEVTTMERWIDAVRRWFNWLRQQLRRR